MWGHSLTKLYFKQSPGFEIFEIILFDISKQSLTISGNVSVPPNFDDFTQPRIIFRPLVRLQALAPAPPCSLVSAHL